MNFESCTTTHTLNTCVCVWGGGGGGRIELHNLQGAKAIDPSESTTNSLPGVGFGQDLWWVHRGGAYGGLYGGFLELICKETAISCCFIRRNISAQTTSEELSIYPFPFALFKLRTFLGRNSLQSRLPF